MYDAYIGTIALFAFDFAPRGWATCQGQILSISQNTALFSLLGTTYGGDGRTTFALPNLSGRTPIGAGQGPGLSPRYQGEQGGQEHVTLLQTEMPAHVHGVNAAVAATSKAPNGNLPAVSSGGAAYGPTASGAMGVHMLQMSGGSQPHPNMQPYLVGNWCIALEGIYPPRP